MTMTEEAAMIRAHGMKMLAEHPEDYAGHPDDEGQCRECSGARTVLVCLAGHRAGCDCAEVEVPCHACR